MSAIWEEQITARFSIKYSLYKLQSTYTQMGCLHSKYIFVNYDKWSHVECHRVTRGRHKAQETVCFQNMLKIENSLKTLWICSQYQSIYPCKAKYSLVNEVNRCLVIMIPGIIRLSVRSINSLNTHNGLNTHFMIQYIEIISAGCPFVTIAAIFSWQWLLRPDLGQVTITNLL